MLAPAACPGEHDHKVRGGSALGTVLSQARPLSYSDDSGFSSLGEEPALAPLVLSPISSEEMGSSSGRHHRFNKLSFLSCFSSAAGAADEDDGCAEELESPVTGADIGIRPCFYWLEAPTSEEERQMAEASARWMKNDCQDDAVVIRSFGGQPWQTFAGVFDGHGPYGRLAAKLASTHIPRLLAMRAPTSPGASARHRLCAMRESCLEAHALLADMHSAGFDAALSGTTACFALVAGRKVLVANAGDSRAVAVRTCPDGSSLEAVQLTWDCKPDMSDERKRIESSGGCVRQLIDEEGESVGAWRVFRRGDDVLPGLAMSRSLGDTYAQAVGVTADPALSTYQLTDRDAFLVLATDGLWDVMSNEEVADFLQRYRSCRDADVSCAEALTLEAQERWKAMHEEAIVDDISVAILHTAPLPPPECSNSLPRPLARAASCNDEANDLFLSWQLERERNPSNHAPRQYFRHLYADDKEGSSSPWAGLAEEHAGEEAAAPPSPTKRAAAPAAAPPAERVPASDSPGNVDTPQGNDWLAAISAASPVVGLVLPPLPHPNLQQRQPQHGAFQAEDSLNLLADGGGASSYEDLLRAGPSSCSSLGIDEGSQRGGGSMHGASLSWQASASQPIPGASGSDPEDVLPPVRKAFPSQASLLMSSYRSEGLMSMGGDTPRSSTDSMRGSGSGRIDPPQHEGKVRGGLPRSISAPGLAFLTMRQHSSSDSISNGGSQQHSVEDRMLLGASMHSMPSYSMPSSPAGALLSPSSLAAALGVEDSGAPLIHAAHPGARGQQPHTALAGTRLGRSLSDTATHMVQLHAELAAFSMGSSQYGSGQHSGSLYSSSGRGYSGQLEAVLEGGPPSADTSLPRPPYSLGRVHSVKLSGRSGGPASPRVTFAGDS